MLGPVMNEETIFAAASEKPANERAAYLKSACDGDAELKARVEQLLAAHDNPDSIFDSPANTEAATTTPAPNLPKRLGDFEIIRQVGQGGMGVVFEARQVSLNRRVALKVLSSGLGLTAKAVMRFRREAEAAAKLHHTNIVPIYSTGEDGGIHFYAMELVEGPSLDKVIQHMRADSTPQDSTDDDTTDEALPGWVDETIAYQRPMGASTGSQPSLRGATSSSLSTGSVYFDAVAKMIADVADALEHAHDNGVIHRDMKPSNLFLAPDGRLSVNDFGLARMLEQPGMTMTGEFVGSPLYMSPEQITAGRAPLDHRTDIYSLGATLYELLTLEPPYPGSRRDEVIGQIMHKEAVRPRRKNKRVPVDLETICLKSIEKDPDRRYQTAGQLAEDLRRFVNRHAISAKRASIVGRGMEWARRHPAIALSVAVALLACLACLGFAYRSQLQDLELARVQREQVRRRLERAKEDALLSAVSGDLESAESHIEEAEQLGASTGWVRMLNGQVAVHRGYYPNAIQQLKQAVRLLPDSAAAQSMLAIAHFMGGDEDRYWAELPKIGQMEALDFQDHLFKGWALSYSQPIEGQRHLDVAISQRPRSPIARLIRATARTRYAMETGTLTDAEIAVRDAEEANSFLPDNPQALAQNLLAHLAVRNTFDRVGDHDSRKDTENKIRKCVSELELFVDHLDARRVRIEYYEHSGETDRILREWAEANDESRSEQDFAFTVATELFRRGKFAEALQSLTHVRSPFSSYVAAYVRMGHATGREEVLRAIREDSLTEPRVSSGVHLFFDWTVLRLLGAESDAHDVARRLYTQVSPIPGIQPWLRHVQFMLNEVSADQLLESCDGSRRLQLHAHFWIGVDCLASGHRAKAKEHFRRARQTDFFTPWAHQWSLAFLERADDPRWLPWLPNDSIPKDKSAVSTQ